AVAVPIIGGATRGDAAHPRLLLDAVVHGLRTMGRVHLDGLPRMADFALWAAASEPALWPAGTCARAYEANRRTAIEGMIDACPVAACVREIMAEHIFRRARNRSFHPSRHPGPDHLGPIGGTTGTFRIRPRQTIYVSKLPAQPRRFLRGLRTTSAGFAWRPPDRTMRSVSACAAGWHSRRRGAQNGCRSRRPTRNCPLGSNGNSRAPARPRTSRAAIASGSYAGT